MTATRGWRGATEVQFVRFVLVGVVSSAVYAVTYLTLWDAGSVLANLVGSVVSTAVANELHRRLTFRSGHRVDWFTAQWEAGALGAAGLVATSVALAGLHGVLGTTGAVLDLALVGLVTGGVGAVRYLALRAWVFPRRPTVHGTGQGR
ncbi:GtrA family protein [Klenkia sp. PcliD-1-E]|uniref:GtrA family protein n=1 Tax=Klenkia sp. PcliD-1-E TaxID=2954492 RepID=UPI0020971874|nr:GtrA family protein [Klenkia sp. PcliD-1-E]MCO7219682.1 GtrA family protein [Klenkia sp. PcliD-1-E]